MDAATAQSAPPARVRAALRPRGLTRRLASARVDVHAPLLGLVLLATFGLRLWGIRQGLPYSYNVDEATHFVPRAIAFFTHDLNPQYFLNPPAYSYLLHLVFELWFGSGDGVTRTFTTDPTQVYVVARLVAGVLGTLSVWLTYLAGERLFGRTVALLGASIFAFAFLPVFYSHLALNDVPTLAPVALSLYGVSGVLRRGWRRDYVIAGAGIGLAAATKYTGGFTVLCLVLAAAADGGRAAWAVAVRRLVLAALVALAAFVIANPYAVLDFSAFTRRDLDPGLAGRGRRPAEARHDGGQRHRLLPVDVHLGAGLDAEPGRASGERSCCSCAAV